MSTTNFLGHISQNDSVATLELQWGNLGLNLAGKLVMELRKTCAVVRNLPVSLTEFSSISCQTPISSLGLSQKYHDPLLVSLLSSY